MTAEITHPTQMTDEQLLPFVVNALIDLSARGRLANSGHNRMYDGDRDLDAILGRRDTTAITTDMMTERYERVSLANSIISKPVNATWRRPPAINDGKDRTTPLCEEWEVLVTKHNLWSAFKRGDKLATLHRYAVLLLGFSGGEDDNLARPVTGNQQLIYVKPYGERFIQEIILDTDLRSERYGRPVTYRLREQTITSTAKVASIRTFDVHYSRIIHIAQGELEVEDEGLPALLPVWDDLDDLIKVKGGSAESYFRAAAEDIMVTLDKDFQFPTTEEREAYRSEIEDRMHRLSRSMIMRGGTAEILRGHEVDPTGIFDVIAKLVAGQTGIPQRILFGSEAGTLASAQDESNWASVIAERQLTYAEPEILRPFVNKMIAHGILPAPENGVIHFGNYDPKSGEWGWPSIEQMNDSEEADIADKRANAMQKAADVAATSDFLDENDVRGFGGLPPREEEA